MPDVRNCKRCGRIYNYIGGAPLCQACRDEDEVDFRRVKEYLYKYPGATMSIVSSELDVSVEKIKRFLKEGRLEIIGDEGNFVLECESCGKAIRTGRFCDLCEKDLARGLQSAVKSMSKEPEGKSGGHHGVGMRYLNTETKNK